MYTGTCTHRHTHTQWGLSKARQQSKTIHNLYNKQGTTFLKNQGFKGIRKERPIIQLKFRQRT